MSDKSESQILNSQFSILLVEDNQMVADLAQFILNKAGYKYQYCEDALKAKELLDNGDMFDLLLTDVVLPHGISGKDLAQYLWCKYPNLPVLFISGYSDGKLTNELLQSRHVGFLKKPFKKDQLLQTIKALIQSEV